MSAAAASHNSSSGDKKKRKKKRSRKGARGPDGKLVGWWRSLDESIVDPISLEPIRDLDYAPFEIVSEHTRVPADTDAAPERSKAEALKTTSTTASVTHYFDGQFLANYVVSTANFINPVNRAPMDHATCTRLDTYLTMHGLPSARVAECFRLLALSAPGNRAVESVHARQLRQEATAVMAALFRTRSQSCSVEGDGEAGVE